MRPGEIQVGTKVFKGQTVFTEDENGNEVLYHSLTNIVNLQPGTSCAMYLCTVLRVRKRGVRMKTSWNQRKQSWRQQRTFSSLLRVYSSWSKFLLASEKIQFTPPVECCSCSTVRERSAGPFSVCWPERVSKIAACFPHCNMNKCDSLIQIKIWFSKMRIRTIKGIISCEMICCMHKKTVA